MTFPIVFINLATDIERRQRMESELRRLNLDAQRLDAIRWATLNPDQQALFYSEKLNLAQYHAPLVAGEKGCYASHHVAWQMLLDGSSDAMVVLEDDVQLVDNFGEVIQAIENLDFSWDMIKLIGRDHEKVRSRRVLVNGVDLIEYQRVPSLTAGYVISRKGAQKLLATRLPFGRPIDVDLRYWWESQLTILGLVPALLRLDETSLTSSIGVKLRNQSITQQWKKFRIKFKMTVLNGFHNFNKKTLF